MLPLSRVCLCLGISYLLSYPASLWGSEEQVLDVLLSPLTPFPGQDSLQIA